MTETNQNQTTQTIGTGRFDYVAYDEKAASMQAGFKLTFQHITGAVEALPPGRATSLALTKLEEAYMWVGKALRDEQVKRNGGAPLQEARSAS
jgi:hydroxyethylthiazole kinase-like sugar kinase family protein